MGQLDMGTGRPLAQERGLRYQNHAHDNLGEDFYKYAEINRFYPRRNPAKTALVFLVLLVSQSLVDNPISPPVTAQTGRLHFS
jgi:hypothetical protein